MVGVTRLGAYEVTGLLGEGGQGSVFAARGPNGARVAVKRIDLRAMELAVAQQLCTIERTLELPPSPACAPMAARTKALLVAQTAHEKACSAARQRLEDGCAKKHDVAGCD